MDFFPKSLSLSLSLQEKQRRQREFTVPGSTAIPHAVSFEDLRRRRDTHLSSSKRSVDSFGNIRRTRSDTDVALQSLKKKVEVCVFVCVFVLKRFILVCVVVTCGR